MAKIKLQCVYTSAMEHQRPAKAPGQQWSVFRSYQSVNFVVSSRGEEYDGSDNILTQAAVDAENSVRCVRIG